MLRYINSGTKTVKVVNHKWFSENLEVPVLASTSEFFFSLHLLRVCLIVLQKQEHHEDTAGQ